MSNAPTTVIDTRDEYLTEDNADSMEGYRRLARIIAEYLRDVSVEPISTGDAGDEAAEE